MQWDIVGFFVGLILLGVGWVVLVFLFFFLVVSCTFGRSMLCCHLVLLSVLLIVRVVLLGCPLGHLCFLLPHLEFAVGFPLFQSSLSHSLSLREERAGEGKNTETKHCRRILL